MRNYKVDQMRIWAACAVVLIHVTAFLPNMGRDTLRNYYWYRPILNLGVPFFFGVSGYLLEMKPTDYIDKYWRNIGLKFIIYSLFYTAFDLVILIIRYQSISEALKGWINLKDVFSFINGTWGQFHLWFLYALMIATYIYGRLIRRNVTPKKIFIIMFAMNFILWIIPRGTIIDSIFLYGGILKGLLYVSMGYYIASKEPKFILTKWQLVILGIIYSVLYNISSIVFMSDLFMAFVTYLLLENIINHKGHPTWLNNFSDYSLDIYVLHVIFLKIIQSYGEVKLWKWLESDFLYILIVSIICVIGSILIYPVANKIFFTPVKRFLSNLR